MRATVLTADAGASGPSQSKWVSNKWRLVCVALTVAALFLVFRRIPAGTLLETIRGMRVGWFIGAVVLYGLMFLPAALRWHLALRMNDSVVDAGATIRFSIIGHFFYLLLFGGAGGDTAKAAVYARRYGLPLPKTLASVSLDRLMGSGALVVVSAIAFAIAAAHGGFEGTKSFSIRGSVWWLLLLLPAIVVALVFLKRSRHESILHRFAIAFLESGRRLVRSPKTVLTGFGCSLLMQVAVNGALAMNLQAVSHAPIPWLRLVWTFPLITAISGLPITFAGIGARDGAAIALLGWCGVAAADAEATSMLTLCVSVLWGLIGGIVLWRETSRPMKFETPDWKAR
jgi:glycosyltransferase 2 family protein